jgi:hypothetical protein
MLLHFTYWLSLLYFTTAGRLAAYCHPTFMLTLYLNFINFACSESLDFDVKALRLSHSRSAFLISIYSVLYRFLEQ